MKSNLAEDRTESDTKAIGLLQEKKHGERGQKKRERGF